MHTEYDTDEVQRVVEAKKLLTYCKLIGGKKKSFTILYPENNFPKSFQR